MAFGNLGLPTQSAGGIGMAAGGAAEEGSGMSLGLILAITQGLNMLLSLFQPSQEELLETQGEVTTQTQKDLMDYRAEMAGKLGVNPPYQSPYLGEVDPVIAKALMANLGRTSNWGWPEGQGINTDFITQALSNMGNIPSISTGPPKPSVYPSRGEWNYPGLPV